MATKKKVTKAQPKKTSWTQDKVSDAVKDFFLALNTLQDISDTTNFDLDRYEVNEEFPLTDLLIGIYVDSFTLTHTPAQITIEVK